MLAILAAGQSNRFGDRDKLIAELGGKMLGLHVSDNLQALPFFRSTIIAPIEDHPCAELWRKTGYEVFANENAREGQSTSVSLAAKQAKLAGAEALCICLADMPFVSTAHIESLMASYAAHDGTHIVASSNGKQAMPPAIFPPSRFEDLIHLDGDKGARSLLPGAITVTGDKSSMVDIDTLDDLVAAECLNILNQ